MPANVRTSQSKCPVLGARGAQSTMSVSDKYLSKSHFESIEILYAGNIFAFNHTKTVVILPRLLLPHHMDLIASIQLSLWYKFSNNPVAQSKHHEK